MAASLTGELGLKVRQPHVISPAAGIDHNGMSALVVAAIDQEPGRAGFAHFAEGHLLLAHALLKRSRDASGKPLELAGLFCYCPKAALHTRKITENPEASRVQRRSLPI